MDNAPNLDCMPIEDLRDLAVGTMHFPRKTAIQLFPEKPKGYVAATKDLGHYAWNKIAAMDSRRMGNITGAQGYEAICDRIYQQLPAFARW